MKALNIQHETADMTIEPGELTRIQLTSRTRSSSILLTNKEVSNLISYLVKNYKCDELDAKKDIIHDSVDRMEEIKSALRGLAFHTEILCKLHVAEQEGMLSGKPSRPEILKALDNVWVALQECEKLDD